MLPFSAFVLAGQQNVLQGIRHGATCVGSSVIHACVTWDSRADIFNMFGEALICLAFTPHGLDKEGVRPEF